VLFAGAAEVAGAAFFAGGVAEFGAACPKASEASRTIAK
jgi:hypothetical protein